MASAAIQTFRRKVTVEWPAHAGDQAKALLLRTAREGHAEIMAAQGNPAFEAYANRPGNSNLDSVVLPGPIVYKYSNLRQLVEFAFDELIKASPVDRGDYVRSHMIFVNGLPVDILPADIKPSDEIMLANPVPYARRLEIGRTKSGRSFVMQVPDRIYERVAKRKLMPRYRNVAKIAFNYVSIPDAWRVKGGLSAHYGTNEKRLVTQVHGGIKYEAGGMKMRKRRQKVGEAIRAPAIIISALS